MIKKQYKKHFLLRLIYRWFAAFGIDLRLFLRSWFAVPAFVKEYRALHGQDKKVGQKWKISPSCPSFHEKMQASGVASGHYFHQDLLIAQQIFINNPKKHVDIGSRVDGFVAHVAAFRKIEVFDIRRQDVGVKNIVFKHCDLMNLSTEYVEYCDSLSCLHALEHFGLGRYGDAIDIDGHIKGFVNIARMVSPNGNLYLSVPIGKERIEFNGHRIFSVSTVLSMVRESFSLRNFSYVDDEGKLYKNGQVGYGHSYYDSLNYGCGIFELVKR